MKKLLFLIFPFCIACATVPMNTKNLDNMITVIDTLPDTLPQKTVLRKQAEQEKKDKTAILKENEQLKDYRKYFFIAFFIFIGAIVLRFIF